jgi:TatD DNase family protein
LIADCIKKGIHGILIPGVKRDAWQRIIELVESHEILYAALGLHPMFIDAHQSSDLNQLEKTLSNYLPVAVGEIGLDYYQANSNRDQQLHYFKVQIQIAKTARLPIVMHVRKAHDEVLSILKQLKFQQGGTVHAFNGSEQQALRYIDSGFKLGFGGAMTYERAKKLQHLAKSLPLESIVLETDAPDMKPATCQATHNSPLYLLDNFDYLVSLREESKHLIAEQTFLNAKRVFRLE